MRDELYVLKSDFRAYNANFRLYQAAKLVYEKIVYEMQGLKSVSWDKIGKQESLNEKSRVIAMLEAKDRAEREMLKYWVRIDNVLTCMHNMTDEERELVTEYFIDGIPSAELAKKHCCTLKQLERKINYALMAGMENGFN